MGSFYLLILSRQHGAFFCFSQDIFTNQLLRDNSFALYQFLFSLAQILHARECYAGRENITASLRKFPKTNIRKALYLRKILGGEI